MRQIALGIAIQLFAILFQLCSSGLETIVLIIGVIGLGFSIFGYLRKDK